MLCTMMKLCNRLLTMMKYLKNSNNDLAQSVLQYRIYSNFTMLCNVTISKSNFEFIKPKIRKWTSSNKKCLVSFFNQCAKTK